MNHWSKIVSIVELDPQAVLTIGTHIVKKRCCIHYDVRWASRPVGLLFVQYNYLKEVLVCKGNSLTE